MKPGFLREIAPTMAILVGLLTTLSRSEETPLDTVETRRYPLWFTPSSVDRIYGLAIMPIGSGLIYDKYQSITGIGIHGIGVGLLVPLFPDWSSFRFKDIGESGLDEDSSVYETAVSSGSHSLKVNGLLLSATGTASSINGVSISLFNSAHSIINGVSICPFINTAFFTNGLSIAAVNDTYRVRGVQIGIFNMTHHLHGVQIGVINRSRNRTTLFFNLSFDD